MASLVGIKSHARQQRSRPAGLIGIAPTSFIQIRVVIDQTLAEHATIIMYVFIDGLRSTSVLVDRIQFRDSLGYALRRSGSNQPVQSL